jgi:hypothetical protein
MNTLHPTARVYRITEMLGNGSAVLDAEDAIMAHHRRFLAALELPVGAEIGGALVCWDDGRVELAGESESAWPADFPQGDVVQLSPMFGGLIHATVVTVSREFDLSIQIAAHIIRTWIKVEYML